MKDANRATKSVKTSGAPDRRRHPGFAGENLCKMTLVHEPACFCDRFQRQFTAAQQLLGSFHARMHQPLMGRGAGHFLKPLREMIGGDAGRRGNFRDGQFTRKVFPHEFFCRSLAVVGKDRVIRASLRFAHGILNQMRADRDSQMFEECLPGTGLTIEKAKDNVGEIAQNRIPLASSTPQLDFRACAG